MAADAGDTADERPGPLLLLMMLLYAQVAILIIAVSGRGASGLAATAGLLAAALLVPRSLRAAGSGKAPLHGAAAAGIVSACAFLAAAAWFGSAWLATVSSALGLVAFAFALGGWSWLMAAVPSAILVALAAPLPLGIGPFLLERVGERAGRLASAILDRLEVPHAWGEAMVRIPGGLLDPRWGSCLPWLAPALVIVAALSLWQGRGVARIAARVAAMTFWMLAFEVARLVGIVLLMDRFSIDLSVGRRGTAAGLAAAGLAAIAAVSTDQLLAAVALTWHWLTVGPRRPTRRSWVRSLVLAVGEARDALRWCAGRVIGSGGGGGGTHRALRVGALAFVILLLAQLLLARPLVASFGVGAPAPPWLKGVGPETLPSALADFRREAAVVATEDETPGADGPRLWLYRRGDLNAVVTLRGPFDVRPDASEAAGDDWLDRGRREVRLPDGSAAEAASLERARALPHAYVIAALLDAEGKPVAPPSDRPEGPLGRLRSLADDRRRPPTYQLAVLLRKETPPSPEDQDAARVLLDAVRRRLTGDTSSATPRESRP